MAQVRDSNQRASNRAESMQTGRGRELMRRNPFRELWGGRDPFDLFGEPFGMFGRGWPFRSSRQGVMWTPEIDTFQRGDEFVVRADLPGLTKDDVKVDLTDDAITIQGERREEHEEDREGYYRSERSYGSFYRTIPLPEGAITDSAKASFNNGVLEIVVQAPPREVSRGRRLEISESSEARSQR